MNAEQISNMLLYPEKAHWDKAEYWDNIAFIARRDGDLLHEVDAKARASKERQKAREYEARRWPS